MPLNVAICQERLGFSINGDVCHTLDQTYFGQVLSCYSSFYLSVVQSLNDVSSHLEPMIVVSLHTCQQSVKSRVSELTVRVVKLFAASIAYITYMVHGSMCQTSLTR